MATGGHPPFVDEHSIVVNAPRPVVWRALRRHVDDSLGLGGRNPLALLLRPSPRSGFEPAAETPPEEVTLTGRHRFSRYALVFRLHDDGPASTRLRALTYAEFPGLHGRVYRALVIGSRAHVVATRGILRAVRRRSLEAHPSREAAEPPGPE